MRNIHKTFCIICYWLGLGLGLILGALSYIYANQLLAYSSIIWLLIGYSASIILNIDRIINE